jgi:hypothetical protein
MIGCTAALTALTAGSALAQESNERTKMTYLTFSAPVEVPGASLAAGKYMFKMADSLGGSHAVQVLSADGKKLYTTFFAVPDQKASSDTPSKPVVMFKERAAGSPQAVQVWFAAGNPAGEEFVYPRSQAMKIAKANRTRVLSTPDGTASSSNNIGRVDENGQFTDSKGAPVAETQVAANEPPAALPATIQSLPRTASPLAAAELLGFLALCGGASMKFYRERQGAESQR